MEDTLDTIANRFVLKERPASRTRLTQPAPSGRLKNTAREQIASVRPSLKKADVRFFTDAGRKPESSPDRMVIAVI